MELAHQAALEGSSRSGSSAEEGGMQPAPNSTGNSRATQAAAQQSLLSSLAHRGAFNAWRLPGAGKRKWAQMEGALGSSEPHTPNPPRWHRRPSGELEPHHAPLGHARTAWLHVSPPEPAAEGPLQCGPSQEQCGPPAAVKRQRQLERAPAVTQLPGDVAEALAVYCAYYELKRQGLSMELPKPVLCTLVACFLERSTKGARA